MRILIDKDACTFLLQLTGKNPCVIEGDATVSRTYSALTLGQLQRLYRNTTGYALEATEYNAALQACKHLAIRLLTTERNYAYDLEKEGGKEADACEADKEVG